MATDFRSSLPNVPAPSGNSAQQYINPGQAFRGDQGASRLLGRLNRAQWEDWKARFRPYVRSLADIAQDETAPRDAARQASQSMGLAFDANQQADEQWRQGLGVSRDSRQQAADEREADVRRRAAQVSAGNQARISALDRQQAILAGGMGLSNIPDKVMDQ
ncbi:hypothetical protein [Halomonas sp. NO4]|uniref:hypothetical protein n=1 Tax=Halomonas sp. NO4 TaxID=2484813 RepID=UPI0013D01FF6|nr:hypothetical protein [Halomonas sp. NO4]